VVYALGEQTVNVATVAEWKFVRHDLGSGDIQTLFWTENLLGSLEILAPGTVLFDTGTMTQNLREFALDDDVALARGAPITRGRSMDRQPVFAPDGETVVFSSNRTGNLDLWAVSTSTGAIRRLTDDAADDWDPGLTADGTKLLWSSDRGGNLEIWIADLDGSGARQVSQDGVDAENPTATPDGEWIVYGSGNPDKLGVWKVRPDGSDATQLVSGPMFVPEVSPDGRYALYGGAKSPGRGTIIRVVEIESGREVPFEIDITVPSSAPVLTYARGRWMPDGRSILFVGADESGRSGLYVQEFVPGRDTSSTRRAVAGFDAELVTESFGISPSGDRLVVSLRDDSNRLVVVEGVPGGVAPPGTQVER
jgi:Tol biopolymer transport system component